MVSSGSRGAAPDGAKIHNRPLLSNLSSGFFAARRPFADERTHLFQGICGHISNVVNFAHDLNESFKEFLLLRTAMDCGNSNKVPFHWAKSTVIITVLVFLILFFAAVRLAYVYKNINRYILFSAALSPFFLTFLYLPLSIYANDGFLIIRRIKGKIRIPIADIEFISKIDKTEIQSSIRIWGSGGLFGYSGIFSHPKFGKFNMYATELSHLYSIKTQNRTYIISCRNAKINAETNILHRYKALHQGLPIQFQSRPI